MSLELIDVRKSYRLRGGGVRHVLRGVSARIRRGESIGILGRNGAGKSTLLRILGGVEEPTTGEIRRRMSVSWPLGYSGAFQTSLTGADNVRFVARIYGKPADQVLGYVQDVAALGPYIRMPLASYSSGMRGRLAFALSLAVDFDCYLVDEAIGTADAQFNERFHAAFRERARRSAMILVTHHASTVRAYCTGAAILDGGVLTFHEDIDEALATYNAL
jgi:capsular polysaccharide transport system ATP-binding protein